ncbi:MAG: hypothetical protein MUD14_28955 [Hydrococcus sp. Prado102]|jgi:hypothetical protein|nr:hypothetical protein [Hydrococcus sp. Prado102]
MSAQYLRSQTITAIKYLIVGCVEARNPTSIAILGKVRSFSIAKILLEAGATEG